MNGRAHLRQIAAALALVTSLSLLAAQSAAALDGRSPDTRAAAAGLHAGVALDLRSPDTREAAGLSGATGGPIEVSSRTSALDLRSPDTREAAQRSGGIAVVPTTA